MRLWLCSWFNDVPSIQKNFTLSGTQTSVTISFRYWAIDSWDIETGSASVNSSVIWSKTVTQYNSTVGWDAYSGNFPAPWAVLKDTLTFLLQWLLQGLC